MVSILHLGVDFSTFRFRVTTFFVENIGKRTKKFSPTPLWGHRLPVTVLALSARGLDILLLKSWSEIVVINQHTPEEKILIFPPWQLNILLNILVISPLQEYKIFRSSTFL